MLIGLAHVTFFGKNAQFDQKLLGSLLAGKNLFSIRFYRFFKVLFFLLAHFLEYSTASSNVAIATASINLNIINSYANS